jgi:hypothetical protein
MRINSSVIKLFLDSAEDLDEDTSVAALTHLTFIIRTLITGMRQILDIKRGSDLFSQPPEVKDEEQISLPFFAHETFLSTLSSFRQHKTMTILQSVAQLTFLLLPLLKIHMESIACHFGGSSQDITLSTYEECWNFYLNALVETLDIPFCSKNTNPEFAKLVLQQIITHTFLSLKPDGLLQVILYG